MKPHSTRRADGNPLSACCRCTGRARGLTLIELLVVIIILTTLVGGVIPVLSPNNDTRKIRGAVRGLQGYITVVQSQAARTGRPHGIGFRESSPGSGVALEVFGLEVPPLFAGFSTESRVIVSESAGPQFYPIPSGRSLAGRRFPQYRGLQLYRLTLKLADGFLGDDFLPPRMFRIGDTFDIDGNQFRVVDTPWNLNRLESVGTAPNDVEYLGSANTPTQEVECVWINSNGQVAPRGLKRYQIARQPTNSSAAPYQLPAGIVIDMQASVAEGSASADLAARFPVDESFYTDRSGSTAPQSADTVGMMFSPTAAVSRVIFNGNDLANSSRIVLLLGRIENGGIDPAVTPYPWVVSNPNDQDEAEQKRADINWLNLDSRLLSIATGTGRLVVSETAFVDLGLNIDVADQIEAAHAFSHEMTTVGGN